MEKSLIEVVDGVIFNSSNQAAIQPGWTANKAYLELDPELVSPYRVRLAATAELKRIAASRCRGKFTPNSGKITEQHELWPNLQTRYPIKTEDEQEPTYVKLEHLPHTDWAWNVTRLAKESRTKQEHSDALYQWGIQQGFLLVNKKTA